MFNFSVAREGNLGELIRRLETPEPLLSDIAEIILRDTLASYESEIDPNGRPWAARSPETKSGSSKILQSSGALLSSIRSAFTVEGIGGEAFAGPSNGLPYEFIHQFGGNAARGARIPQRAYVGASDQMVMDIREAYLRYWLFDV